MCFKFPSIIAADDNICKLLVPPKKKFAIYPKWGGGVFLALHNCIKKSFVHPFMAALLQSLKLVFGPRFLSANVLFALARVILRDDNCKCVFKHLLRLLTFYCFLRHMFQNISSFHVRFVTFLSNCVFFWIIKSIQWSTSKYNCGHSQYPRETPLQEGDDKHIQRETENNTCLLGIPPSLRAYIRIILEFEEGKPLGSPWLQPGVSGCQAAQVSRRITQRTLAQLQLHFWWNTYTPFSPSKINWKIIFQSSWLSGMLFCGVPMEFDQTCQGY